MAIRCRKCKNVYDTKEFKKCPKCGSIPKVRPKASKAAEVPKRGVSAGKGSAIAGPPAVRVAAMDIPSWLDEKTAEKREKMLKGIITMPSPKLSERQRLVELQFRAMDVAKKSLELCPKCSEKIKSGKDSFKCKKCGFGSERKDVLSHAYFDAAFALRPLILKGEITEAQAQGILTHVAVFLGTIPEFDMLPDDWSCPACGMPKKRFRRMKRKRFVLF